MAKVFNDQNVGETLQHFVDRAVRPTETEMNNFGEEVHTVVQFLQTQLLTAPYKVAEVYKGGSLKKGTAVRGSSDIDLVVFVNGLEDIKDLQRERKKLLKRIRQKVEREKWPTVSKPTIKKYGICCKIKEHTVDILPAFDAVEKYGSPSAVYAAMERYRQTLPKGGKRKHNVGMQFSASLSPLQADFIKEAPGNVKDVIRLLKKWKKERGIRIPSYCMELLGVFQWKKNGWTSTDKLFCDVIAMLADSNSIRVAMPYKKDGVLQYDVTEFTRNRQHPYILDPVNPFLNTFTRIDIHKLTTEASRTLRQLRQA